MKQFILSSVLVLNSILPAYCFFPDSALIQTHEMQTLQQQRFRLEEINDYNDVQEEKARYWKKNSTPDIKQQDPKIVPTKKEFTEENGELKIKYVN